MGYRHSRSGLVGKIVSFCPSNHVVSLAKAQSEDLFISTKEIRVRYSFINNSDDDVVTQVAFPIPDIPYGVDDFNFAIPTTDPQNILGFETTANGRRVDVRVEQKALIGGMDRTEILRRFGIPIAPR